MFKEYKELAKQWNTLEDDFERLAFLRDHPKKMKIMLDNDCSNVDFIPEDEYDEQEVDFLYDLSSELNDFDEDMFGDDDGVFNLFEFMGITAEGV